VLPIADPGIRGGGPGIGAVTTMCRALQSLGRALPPGARLPARRPNPMSDHVDELHCLPPRSTRAAPRRRLPSAGCGRWRLPRRSSGSHGCVLVLAACVFTACCGDAAGPKGVQPERLGQPVTADGVVWEHSPLHWSADGQEVFFLDQMDHLFAVRVSSGVVRVVADEPTQVLFVSADGHWIYRTAGGMHPYVRVVRSPTPGGVAELLVPGPVSRVVLSTDGNLIAYAILGDPGDPHDARVTTRDTLALLDLRSGQYSVLGFGNPLAFSPDGTRLAYDEAPCLAGGLFANPCDSYVLDLVTGTREHIPWEKDDNGKQAWWNAEGLQSLASTHAYDDHTTFLQWIVRNLTRQTVRIVYALNARSEMPAAAGFAHSRDGSRVAGWYFNFREEFEGLLVADLRTGRDSLIVVNRTAEGWSPSFSHDGRRIAYLIGRRIYVQDLPESW
jgi:hypothetical protein